MDKTGDFFDANDTHGIVKRFIYVEYLKAFLNIINNARKLAVIFDGFAGKGRYDNHSEEKKSCKEADYTELGSPLLSLKVGLDRISKAKQTRIIYIFVEKDEKNFESLTKEITQMLTEYEILSNLYYSTNGTKKENKWEANNSIFDIKIYLIKESFQEVAKSLKFVEEESDAVQLSIIDPFGYSDITMDIMDSLIGYKKEAIITFMSKFINRFYIALKHQSNIKKTLGISNNQELPILISKDKTECDKVFTENGLNGEMEYRNSVEEIVAFFKDRLNGEYTLSFEMRNKSNQLAYHLLQCTNSYKGFIEMKRVFHKASLDNDSHIFSSFIMKHNHENFQFGKKIEDNHVAELIHKKFSLRDNVEENEIRNFIEFETIGWYYKNPLRFLIRNGRAIEKKTYNFSDFNDQEQPTTESDTIHQDQVLASKIFNNFRDKKHITEEEINDFVTETNGKYTNRALKILKDAHKVFIHSKYSFTDFNLTENSEAVKSPNKRGNDNKKILKDTNIKNKIKKIKDMP